MQTLATIRAQQGGGGKLTSNEPRGSLLGLPTPKLTTLNLRLGLERLRRTRRGQERKRRKLGVKARSNQEGGNVKRRGEGGFL